jgi:hypothetical protein
LAVVVRLVATLFTAAQVHHHDWITFLQQVVQVVVVLHHQQAARLLQAQRVHQVAVAIMGARAVQQHLQADF